MIMPKSVAMEELAAPHAAPSIAPAVDGGGITLWVWRRRRMKICAHAATAAAGPERPGTGRRATQGRTSGRTSALTSIFRSRFFSYAEISGESRERFGAIGWRKLREERKEVATVGERGQGGQMPRPGACGKGWETPIDVGKGALGKELACELGPPHRERAERGSPQGPLRRPRYLSTKRH